MSIPVWPSDLPQAVLVDGFAYSQAEGRLTSRTDTGPGKARLMNSAAITPVRAQIRVTPAQLARFRRFYSEDLGQGVNPFWMRDQIFDGMALSDADGALLTDGDGKVLTMASCWLARFGLNMQTLPRPGFLFRIEFDLELLP